jgi:hypothetical protein
MEQSASLSARYPRRSGVRVPAANVKESGRTPPPEERCLPAPSVVPHAERTTEKAASRRLLPSLYPPLSNHHLRRSRASPRHPQL